MRFPRLYLFPFLLGLRLTDFIQTYVGLRNGLSELNPLVNQYGFLPLIVLNVALILTLLALYLVAHYYVGHEAIPDIVLVLFIAWSLYAVAWVNPHALLSLGYSIS